MRFVLSLVVVAAAASAAYAQNQKTNSGGLQGSFGSSDSATGGLRGVYGPPGSSAGQLPGVHAPPRSPAATPFSSGLTGNLNSGTVPSVSVPGSAQEGQSLPGDVKPDPMPDRPGYGRATVNGRPAIIDMNDNRIVNFSN